MAEFTSDTEIVWTKDHRIALFTDTYELSFYSAIADDTGDYVCLVNSRPQPDGIIRLIVQGKNFSFLVFQRSITALPSLVTQTLII